MNFSFRLLEGCGKSGLLEYRDWPMIWSGVDFKILGK